MGALNIPTALAGSMKSHRSKVKKLPVLIRTTNSLISLQEKVSKKSIFTLEADEALDLASKETGLSDFDDDIRPALKMQCETLISPPALMPLARMVRRNDIFNRLARRLYLKDILKKNPAILDKPIRRPWIILGLPRTGTTLLHRLLAQDPSNRAPLFWQTEYFYPVPTVQNQRVDPRVKLARKNLRLFEFIDPEFKARHETGAELPEECLGFLCDGLVLGLWVDLSPKIREWVNQQDMTKSYQLHKQHLQVLQWQNSNKTWVLKSPLHLAFLPCLIKTYPDACIIQTHRDPAEVLPSAASLLQAISRLKYGHVDPAEVGRQTFQDLRQMLTDGMLARHECVGRPGSQNQFIDIRYRDLVKDPLQTVAQIYHAFGTTLTDEARNRMEKFLTSNQQYKFGKMRYDPEDFGFKSSEVSREFAAYTEQFLGTL